MSSIWAKGCVRVCVRACVCVRVCVYMYMCVCMYIIFIIIIIEVAKRFIKYFFIYLYNL